MTDEIEQLRRMPRGALEGRNQARTDAEIAAVERRLGLPPKLVTRRRRVKRWFRHRYWRVRFWIEGYIGKL